MEVGQVTEVEIRVHPEWRGQGIGTALLLSVLVGAMVGLIGFVVTVTVLVIQQATGTLSPRYMRLWYRDPFQKIVLATFAGTLTFSLSLLRRVTDNAVPNVGVTAAYQDWENFRGSAFQLAINMAATLLAGTATLAIQRMLYNRRRREHLDEPGRAQAGLSRHEHPERGAAG